MRSQSGSNCGFSKEIISGTRHGPEYLATSVHSNCNHDRSADSICYGLDWIRRQHELDSVVAQDSF